MHSWRASSSWRRQKPVIETPIITKEKMIPDRRIARCTAIAQSPATAAYHAKWRVAHKAAETLRQRLPQSVRLFDISGRSSTEPSCQSCDHDSDGSDCNLQIQPRVGGNLLYLQMTEGETTLEVPAENPL